MKEWWKERRPYTKGGVIATAAWLFLVALYCFLNTGKTSFLNLELSEFGDFCAGVFAPLAFLWLIVGYAQQAEELSKNVEALRQQSIETAHLVQQAQLQAEAIKSNELHARRDTFMRFADPWMNKVYDSIAQMMSLAGHYQTDEVLMRRLASREHRAVLVDFLDIIRHQSELFRERGDNESIIQAKEKFMSDFEALLKFAMESDKEAFLYKLYWESPVADIYREFQAKTPQ